ncbi:DUF6531 domain-containing protein [Massilia sp. H-1]|nr:DUF6531 domain-containing protein [Massilia sp. H-1]
MVNTLTHSRCSRKLLLVAISYAVIPLGFAQNSFQDATCFPLYREAGAIPGTGLDCKAAAADADVGLGNRFCTSSPEIIERYCGTVATRNSCPANVGNPIDASTGNKHQAERDYAGTGLFPLHLTRYYNSNGSHASGDSFGPQWTTNFDRRIVKSDSSMLYVARADGKLFYFKLSGTNWVSVPAGNSDSLVQVKDGNGNTTGWKYADSSDGSIEDYAADGRLFKITARNGQSHTLTRSISTTPSTVAPGPGYLIKVTDTFSRSLQFTWNNDGTVATMKDPAGYVYTYTYVGTRLSKVAYPTVDASIQAKSYLYNEPEHTSGVDDPALLTGIEDENGKRYATFEYDAAGRANLTEHALGADRHTLTYGTNQTTIVDPRGTSRTFSFVRAAGALRLSAINKPGGAGCAASANLLTYDANGNLKNYKDFNGMVTTYTYDLARNLETQRVDAFGTPQVRTTTTEWHPTFNYPQRIAEPKRITTFTYYPTGNPETKTVRTTSDLTGAQGLAATQSTAFLKSTYTYDPAKQIIDCYGACHNGATAYDPHIYVQRWQSCHY